MLKHVRPSGLHAVPDITVDTGAGASAAAASTFAQSPLEPSAGSMAGQFFVGANEGRMANLGRHFDRDSPFVPLLPSWGLQLFEFEDGNNDQIDAHSFLPQFVFHWGNEVGNEARNNDDVVPE